MLKSNIYYEIQYGTIRTFMGMLESQMVLAFGRVRSIKSVVLFICSCYTVQYCGRLVAKGITQEDS